MQAAGGQTPFTVLFVCTANRYRSPMAEQLMRREMATRAANWVIGSAGTQAREDDELDEAVVALIGVDDDQVQSWRSRRLTEQLVQEADLVLTAEEAHRQAVAQLWPRALRHTYTLLRFARLAAQVEPESLATGHALIEAVNEARAHIQPPKAGADDLADPVRNLRRRLPGCAAQVGAAVATLTAPLEQIEADAHYAR